MVLTYKKHVYIVSIYMLKKDSDFDLDYMA